MSLRRIAASLLALAAACAKDVKPEPAAPFVDYSVFDPAAGELPLPNDLALASAVALPDGAQKDLLLAFAAQGGFPHDMEVPVTIGFRRVPVGPGAPSAPAIDLASITPATLALLRVDVFPPEPVAYEVAGQSSSGATTTLTLRAPAATDGSRSWAPGAQYVVAVRGGQGGVKTAGGGIVRAMPAMYLLLLGKNLADPANQALLSDPSAGGLLEQIRQSYLPAFQVVDSVFPARELANLATFAIAPAAGTYVRVDETAGVVPLPFDLLRTDADGTIVYNPAFGGPAAAAGIDTLDGFSTTGMMLAPTSGPVDAATVTGQNVFLFELPAGGPPALVRDLAGAIGVGAPAEAVYVTQPTPLVRSTGCGSASSCSDAIGLQPAVPVPVPGVSLRPLDEDIEYAVVITNGVKDTASPAQGLVRSTLARILLDVAHPVSVNGASQLAGIGDATAAMLEHMRQRLAPVYGLLPGGKTKADVAMAYTFKTQSVTGVSLQLSALPYLLEQGAGAAVFTPVAATDVTADYAVLGLKGPAVDSFWSVSTPTLDAIDPTTGALRPDLATLTPAQMAALVRPLPALVAVPTYASVPSCGLPPPAEALHCAKVVIFEHGLNGGHRQMVAFANALAARGFVVAAIDFPLHGDRAYCSVAADCDGGTCDLIPGGEGQGDASPPGICSTRNRPTPDLSTVASGRYFVSANFFRIRDAFRQNLLDQSALALSMARPPGPLAPQPAVNPLADALAAKQIVIDPSEVYFEGISLGGIAGTQVLATNPRVSRGVLSVAGGTTTDVMTDPDSVFGPSIDALFQDSFGFDRNDPANGQRYLQILTFAKWILDPGDPLNFASHLVTSPLPDLLSPTPALQAPKDVWGMVAQGDTVVRNPYNLLLYGNAAIPFTTYTLNGGNAPHGFLATYPKAQGNAADFLLDPDPPPPATVDLP